MSVIQQVRLKYVASINDDKLAEDTDPGLTFRYVDIGAVGRGELVEDPEPQTFASAPSRARRLVQRGDTIVSTVRTYLRAAWTVSEPADDLVVSTGFAVVRPRSVDADYLAWALQSDAFIEAVVARSVGVSYPAINPAELASLPVPLPPRDEQRRIAAFLNAETARIDELVDAKAQMIDLLEEVARATAEEVLVAGLVRSGEPRTTLRHLNCEVQTGPFGSQLHQHDYVEGGTPVVNPANLKGGGIVRIAEMAVGDEKAAELQRHRLVVGDIVFGRRGEMGRAGLVTTEEAGWLCGTGSLRLRLLDDRLSPEFLKMSLETRAAKDYFSLNSVGSTMENLNSDIVLGFPTFVPPVETQTEIVRRVTHATLRARELQSVLRQQIGLLVERRRSLITGAVTGELEVG